MCYFRETGQLERLTTYLKSAIEKCPNREDLLLCLFLNYVQDGNFSAQQSTARILSQNFSSRDYVYWVIVSTLLQADSDPAMADRVYLPLAEKMLAREVENGKVETHVELQLYLELLLRLGKQSNVLELLNRKELIDRLNKLDYRFDYSQEILDLHVSLNEWESAFAAGSQMLKSDPDNWNAWKGLISVPLRHKSWDDACNSIIKLQDFTEDLVTQHPAARGPQLARLDLSASLLRRGWQSPSTSDLRGYLLQYFERFGSKFVCALDLAYLVPVLLCEREDQEELMDTLISDVESNQTPRSETKQIQRHVCCYQIARASSRKLSLEKLLSVYFSYVPERTETPTVNSDESAERPSESVDLHPADGFLLLILSYLVEAPRPPAMNPGVHQFSAALVAAHWTEHIGIMHATSNHHFRLRLCQLFLHHTLGCPDQSLHQTERLEVKQLLFVSLGHFVLNAGPLLTIWANSPQFNQQTDTCSPILSLYQRVHALAGTMVSESEECLVAAYRRRAYTKIREFTQFADRLRHADVFLLARMELVYWQLAVVPEDFDSLLEHLSAATKEVSLVEKRLCNIRDCRDCMVSPNFDPLTVANQTQADSFQCTVSWIRLRLIAVNSILHSARLVMSTVKMSDQLLENKDGAMTEKVKTDERGSDAQSQLESCLSRLTALKQDAHPIPDSALVNTLTLIESLVLPCEHLFTSPPQLPPTTFPSLYLHGPYYSVLSSGIRLVVGFHRLLSEGPEAFSEEDELGSLRSLQNPFSETSLCTSFPSPVQEAESYSSSPSSCHPAGVLLLMGAVYEVITLSCLFISVLRSMLRPRSHFRSQLHKRQRRKGGKASKGKVREEEAKVSQHNSDESSDSPVLKRLDSIGSRLLVASESLSSFANGMANVTDAWETWAKTFAATHFAELASAFCSQNLPTEFIEHYPNLVPTKSTQLLTEIASSFEKAFGRLSTGLRLKAANLNRMHSELAVYECVEGLSQCNLKNDQ
ncbi:unnamed protein product [Calicophoron daubneyi]